MTTPDRTHGSAPGEADGPRAGIAPRNAFRVGGRAGAPEQPNQARE